MTLLVDTNICVHFLNNERAVVEQWRAHKPEQLRICSVVKAELLYGARYSARVADNLRQLKTFFASLISLPFDDAAADAYGVVHADLRRQGTVIGSNDMQIGAIALAHGLSVVTRNDKEFSRVAGLDVVRW